LKTVPNPAYPLMELMSITADESMSKTMRGTKGISEDRCGRKVRPMLIPVIKSIATITLCCDGERSVQIAFKSLAVVRAVLFMLNLH